MARVELGPEVFQRLPVNFPLDVLLGELDCLPVEVVVHERLHLLRAGEFLGLIIPGGGDAHPSTMSRTAANYITESLTVTSQKKHGTGQTDGQQELKAKLACRKFRLFLVSRDLPPDQVKLG